MCTHPLPCPCIIDVLGHMSKVMSRYCWHSSLARRDPQEGRRIQFLKVQLGAVGDHVTRRACTNEEIPRESQLEHEIGRVTHRHDRGRPQKPSRRWGAPCPLFRSRPCQGLKSTIFGSKREALEPPLVGAHLVAAREVAASNKVVLLRRHKSGANGAEDPNRISGALGGTAFYRERAEHL